MRSFNCPFHIPPHLSCDCNGDIKKHWRNVSREPSPFVEKIISVMQRYFDCMECGQTEIYPSTKFDIPDYKVRRIIDEIDEYMWREATGPFWSASPLKYMMGPDFSRLPFHAQQAMVEEIRDLIKEEEDGAR
jgi:hypothetical protein